MLHQKEENFHNEQDQEDYSTVQEAEVFFLFIFIDQDSQALVGCHQSRSINGIMSCVTAVTHSSRILLSVL